MDVITLLKDDHRRIEKLFTGFERTGERARKTRKRLVDQMAAELTMHTTLEEQVFYPLVRQSVTAADFVILEAREEHHVVKMLLNELAEISPRDERFAPKVAVLTRAVREHVEWEELDIVPRTRRAWASPRRGDRRCHAEATTKGQGYLTEGNEEGGQEDTEARRLVPLPTAAVVAASFPLSRSRVRGCATVVMGSLGRMSPIPAPAGVGERKPRTPARHGWAPLTRGY